MSKSAKNGDADLNLVDALDEIHITEQGLWYVLIAGDGSTGGASDEAGAFIMSRCLLEVVTGYAFDAAGRFVSAPHPGSGQGTAKSKRVRDRVRRALRDGKRAGAEFVICYHVEGDPGWYMEWSAAHSRRSAVDAARQYLTGGILSDPGPLRSERVGVRSGTEL